MLICYNLFLFIVTYNISLILKHLSKNDFGPAEAVGRSQTRPVEAFVVTENKNRPFQKRFRAPRSAVAYRFLGWSIFYNGLSFISLGFLGYFPGVFPVFLMYTMARLSSSVGKVTVFTSSMEALSVLRALWDSPISSS